MAKASQDKNSSTCMPSPLPIVSSETLGWQPLLVEEFRQPPREADFLEVEASYSIALCLASKPTPVKVNVCSYFGPRGERSKHEGA